MKTTMKTTPKHTPGKWTINGNAIFDSCGQRIATANEPFYRRGDEAPRSTIDAMVANARLIAAAPELLEALYQAKEIMEISEVEHAVEGQVGREPYLNICAAIAKAEGTQS